MSENRVPVLIVGGGLAGLSLALFLGRHGVTPLLVEKHPGTTTEIKARGIYPHAMEALRVGGVADRIREASGGRGAGDLSVVIAERLAGPVLKSVMAATEMDMGEVSPEDWSLAAQEDVEPILVDAARGLGADLRFGTELVSLRETDDGVVVVLRDVPTGREEVVVADHVVAADGWRSRVREALGIGVHGRGVLGYLLRVFFEADLREQLAHLDGVADGRRFALVHLVGGQGHGTFYSTGTPGRYGYFPALTREPSGRAGQSEEYLVELVRTGLGLPDVPIKIADVAETVFACDVADRFTAGRVHLIGDAAKVVPPTGGLGGNTAIMDAFYLAWKLAAVVRGQAGPGLLASHDTERRPVAEMIADQQFTNLVTRAEPSLDDGSTVPLLPAITQAFGYRYPSGAIVPEPDDDGAGVEDPTNPTGRPGSRAPHVVLRYNGRTTSTTALLGRGFVLFTSPTGRPWERQAAEAARALDVDIAVHRIGTDNVTDENGDWTHKYGVDAGGATLIRPDRFVAWRTRTTPTDDTNQVEQALRTILDCPL